MTFSLRTARAAALAAVAVTAALPAAAVDLVYTLDLTAVNAFGSGPYATVTLHEVNATTVDVTVDPADGFRFVKTGNTGSHNSFTFNMALAGITVTDITSAFQWIHDGTPPPSLGNSPYGSYTDAITLKGQNGGAGAFDGILEFTVSRAAGLKASDFTTNSGGFYFSADLITRGATGAVSTDGPGTLVTPVPEPETYSLLLAGLGVMGFIARRRRTQA